MQNQQLYLLFVIYFIYFIPVYSNWFQLFIQIDTRNKKNVIVPDTKAKLISSHFFHQTNLDHAEGPTVYFSCSINSSFIHNNIKIIKDCDKKKFLI